MKKQPVISKIKMKPENQSISETGIPGRNTHYNQQGAIGVVNGPVVAIGRHLKLRYSEIEINIRLLGEDGESDPGIFPYSLPGFRLSLLDGHLPAVTAEFDREQIHYQLAFLMVPDESGPFDLCEISVENRGEKAATGRLCINIDGPLNLELGPGTVLVGKTPVAYFSSGIQAEILQRAVGLCDLTATASANSWETPLFKPNPAKHDIAFFSGRIGWDYNPVEYRFAAEKGKRYTVFAGVCDFKHSTPGQREVNPGEKIFSVDVEGDSSQTIDYRNDPQLDSPRLLRFNATDTDGDGAVWIRSQAKTEIPDAIALLSGIWVFPEEQFNEEDVLKGRLNEKALFYVNVGGSAPIYYPDEWVCEDPSFLYAALKIKPSLRPGEKAQYLLRIPAIDRPEPMAYALPRRPRWHNPGERRNLGIEETRRRETAALLPEEAKARVRKYWEEQFKQGARYLVPEKTVVDLYKASLAQLFIHRLPLKEGPILPIGGGPQFYFDFAERDCAYGVHAIDLAGFGDDAESLLENYLKPKEYFDQPRWHLGQWKDGSWLTRGHEQDTQGQVLWTLGEHFRFSGNLGWLTRAYPFIKRGVEYVISRRADYKARINNADDPRYGLWIPGYDESGKWGEVTNSYYFSYWTVAGLRLAVTGARAMGRTDDAQRWQTELNDLLSCLRKSIAKTFYCLDERRGHLIRYPEYPASDDIWGTQEAVWPGEVLDPHDPKVTATLRFMEERTYSRRGVFVLGDDAAVIWPSSASAAWAMNYLYRGEPDRVVEIFYAMIDNAGPTLSWAETVNLTTNRGAGDQPYTWGHACYIILLRHMLIHEQGNRLHIAPAIPRKWLSSPEGITVEEAPTCFGELSYHIKLRSEKDILSAKIELNPRKMPEEIILHLRLMESYRVREVRVNDGAHELFTDTEIILRRPEREMLLEVFLSRF